MPERGARLLSDFDGTAIQTVRKTDWRNWFKAGIPIIDGYLDFLTGVEKGGVEVAGIISRRNDRIRRGTTMHSVNTLGLDEFFPGPEQVWLTGTEERKAERVAQESANGPIGLLEDRPDRFGKALLSALGGEEHAPITIGAVFHPEMNARKNKLAQTAQNKGLTAVSEQFGGLMIVEAGIRVVPLKPYSAAQGERFAEEILQTAAMFGAETV